MLSVFTPIEPVEPKTKTFFIFLLFTGQKYQSMTRLAM